MNNDHDVWDEFQWEEFMKQQDKKVDRYMELFYRYKNDPNRDEIIAREMGWEWLISGSDDEQSNDVEMDEIESEEGEEWKNVLYDSEEELEREIFQHPVYLTTKEFALQAISFVDHLPENLREDSSVVDFLSNAMVAGAKIAGGTGIGDDAEELGGNIAYCKRGLAAANLAIAALHEMKEKGIVTGATYMDLMRNLTEVRNVIATHILDLREKFRRGV